MKKAIILEEGDYNLVVSALNAAKDVLKRMKKTQNVGHLEYHIDRAIRLLKDEDSSIRDLKNRIESHTHYID